MKSGIKPTNYQVQVKIFEAAGCTYVRTQGDHLVYHYPGAKRPVVIPKYKEVPVFIIYQGAERVIFIQDAQKCSDTRRPKS